MLVADECMAEEPVVMAEGATQPIEEALPAAWGGSVFYNPK